MELLRVAARVVTRVLPVAGAVRAARAARAVVPRALRVARRGQLRVVARAVQPLVRVARGAAAQW